MRINISLHHDYNFRLWLILTARRLLNIASDSGYIRTLPEHLYNVCFSTVSRSRKRKIRILGIDVCFQGVKRKSLEVGGFVCR